MASDIEINRIRNDTDGWQLLVQQLLRYEEAAFEAKDFSFLESLESRKWLDSLSYRQAEWLIDIRDSVQTVSDFRGYSVKYLIQRCHENRFDLNDDGDQVWLTGLHQSRPTTVRRNEARRLYRLAKRLGEIDDWAA